MVQHVASLLPEPRGPHPGLDSRIEDPGARVGEGGAGGRCLRNESISRGELESTIRLELTRDGQLSHAGDRRGTLIMLLLETRMPLSSGRRKSFEYRIIGYDSGKMQ